MLNLVFDSTPSANYWKSLIQSQLKHKFTRTSSPISTSSGSDHNAPTSFQTISEMLDNLEEAIAMCRYDIAVEYSLKG